MKVNIILADPPWSFQTWSQAGNGRGAERHYPTMTFESICSLPVKDLADDSAALFLWAVWPSIFEARRVMEAWGFTYRTCAFLWVKAKRSGIGFHTGMGYYTRANSEACLLGVRGKMPVSAHDVTQVIYSPVREHSRKPDEQYSKIERLYPGGRYLELFARRKRAGWLAWGNQVECDIEMAGIGDSWQITN